MIYFLNPLMLKPDLLQLLLLNMVVTFLAAVDDTIVAVAATVEEVMVVILRSPINMILLLDLGLLINTSNGLLHGLYVRYVVRLVI
jgi:hypothetical protein